MDRLVLFMLAALALLGSPGPGIAALMAVGRSHGVAGSLRYFAAMQLGLALSSALSAAGLAAVLQAFPPLHGALLVISIVYLLWLAWTIASAPLGGAVGTGDARGLSLAGGFLLGAANPKAYLAFASLFGSFVVLQPAYGLADQLAKWAACLTVMILVDLAWMLAGVALGRIALRPRSERAMNVAMGGAILAACIAAVL